MEHNLLYEYEYKVENLRKAIISQLEYEELTIKEMLDLGINDTTLKVDNNYYNLGYKWYVKNYETNKEENGYTSNDFELNEDQLNCKIKLYNYDYNDYGYMYATFELVNEEDKKYFGLESESE